MSWEEDEYLPAIAHPPVVTTRAKPKNTLKAKPVKSRSSSRSRAKATERLLMTAMQSLAVKKAVSSDAFRKNTSNTTDYVIDLHGKNITTLPEDDPRYVSAKVLILRNNALTELDMSKLPRNLVALDVRMNNIKEFTHVDRIPKTLQTIHFDDNLLTEHPPLPESVNFISSSGNPFKRKDLFKDILDGLPEKSILWFHKDDAKEKIPFTEEEQAGGPFILKVYDEDTMRNIMGFANDFIKDTLCHSRLSGHYISAKIVYASNLLVEVVGGEVVAVAIFKLEFLNRKIYVDVLCSASGNKGGGSRLLKILIGYMNVHPNIERITLDSLFGARGFYEKMGFKRCVEGEICPMELIRSAVSGGGHTRKNRKNN